MRYLQLLLVILFAQACAQPVPAPAIRLNQLGFYPNAPKIGIVAGSAPSDIFYILTAQRDTVLKGELGPKLASANSSLTTRLADFSSLKKEGAYLLVVPFMPDSWPFRIQKKVLSPLARAALKGYYYQRSAMPLTAGYAGIWARAAGHPDTAVLIHPSAATTLRPAGTIISTPGGWYDAGDYNKYIVNSGITMGTLLSAYEDFPAFFDTLRTNIPPLPNGEGLPDILNETLYNLRWMLTMQDPGDGGVYNKCTNASFDGMVRPGVTTAPRYVVAKGTAATLDFAAVMAQAARILKKFQRQLPGLSDSCRNAATHAWDWAVEHPAMAYDQDAMNRKYEPKISTGGYGDTDFSDEWFWAASELMVSGFNEKYVAIVRQKIETPISLPSWSNVQMMGNYTLLRYHDRLPSSLQNNIGLVRGRLITLADEYLAKEYANAFHAVMGNSERNFVWGSNSVAANQGMLLIYAWLQTGDKKYIGGALDNLDYLLGRNATGYCFITGIGSHSPMHPHHRPSISDGIEAPVPGLLAGGPNPGRQDRSQYTFLEPETSYTDQDGAYASNEIAINWNAPLVYLAGAIEAIQYKVGYSK